MLEDKDAMVIHKVLMNAVVFTRLSVAEPMIEDLYE